MNRARWFSLSFALGVTLFGVAVSAQNAVNATGNWKATGGAALATGMVALQQTGSSISGSYGQGGKVEGTFKPGTAQVDGNWGDARGNGWLTVTFAADGNSFSCDWGYAGRKPSGHFTASRVVPAYPVVTGVYNVSVTGSQEFTSRQIKLHQLGQTVVGNFGPDTQLSGTMATESDEMTGTWQGPRGSGWIRLRFASDSRSFQGEWGLGSESQARGNITGSIVNTTQLWVRGLWETASSSIDLAGGWLKLEQNGQTVTGVFKDGHFQGALPRGSNVLVGRWRGEHGTGDISLTFGPDGNNFQGSWTRKGNEGGKILGKRNFASSSALRP
jgi:hypothetical protein